MKSTWIASQLPSFRASLSEPSTCRYQPVKPALSFTRDKKINLQESGLSTARSRVPMSSFGRRERCRGEEATKTSTKHRLRPDCAYQFALTSNIDGLSRTVHLESEKHISKLQERKDGFYRAGTNPFCGCEPADESHYESEFDFDNSDIAHCLYVLRCSLRLTTISNIKHGLISQHHTFHTDG
jgi:hypothetical protein